MADNKKASYQSNRITREDIKEPVVQKPDVDVVAKSAGTKNDLYGPQYEHGNKYMGAARVWNKNRPLAKGGRRP